MNSTLWTWLFILTLWCTFFCWYTSFQGPLTEEEIEAYLSIADTLDETTDPNRVEVLRRFMEEDTGDDFIMLNIGRNYDSPLAVEGVEPGQTTEEVLSNYLAYVVPALISRASHPVQFGDAASTALELLNADGMSEWDNTVSMRYRSRRDFMDFATDPRMPPAHIFKVAAMEKAIAFPVDPWFHFGDLRIVLALILGLIGSTLSWVIAIRRSRRAEAS